MSHDMNFVAAYHEIDQFLKTCGLAPLRDPSLRLMWAPRQSVATSIRNAEQHQLQSTAQPGRGCALIGLLIMAVIVALAIMAARWCIMGLRMCRLPRAAEPTHQPERFL
jgi:hypothetical protein